MSPWVETKRPRRDDHRRVAEEKLCRQLRRGEVVHHRNGLWYDNRPENLRVFRSASAHSRHEGVRVIVLCAFLAALGLAVWLRQEWLSR